MATKRTIHIGKLIDEVNGRNRTSTCGADHRYGWNSLLESFLHKNNAYAGFCYLTQDQVPECQLPGIIRSESGNDHQFPDTSRVNYHHHKNI